MQNSYLVFFLPLLALVTVGAVPNCEFYHFKIGNVNATVISDGVGSINIDGTFTGVHPEAVKLASLLNFRSEDTLELYANPLHLDMGDRKVMIDVGSANTFQPTFGKLLDNMAAAGLDPMEVDDVLLTHGHLDHLGGLIKPGGGLAFPNAKIHISRVEYAFWRKATIEDMPTGISEALKTLLLEVAQRTLTTVSMRIKTFELGNEVIPGITSRSTVGHTPGHAVYIIRSGEDSLLNSGDALPWEAYSIQHPDWPFALDYNTSTGAFSRFSLLKELADSSMKFLTYHNDFPGLGHIVETAQGYDLRHARHQF